ncbi:hypothetical protein [Arthrobacter sp. CJ23]|nr:hypothetical protein [Arthrobacter sp. CJ23]UVJ38727.1 hypothetical protein NVV90_16110 [Arthrobacter sp. CJ23]
MGKNEYIGDSRSLRREAWRRRWRVVSLAGLAVLAAGTAAVVFMALGRVG